MDVLEPVAYSDITELWEKEEEKKTGIDVEDQSYYSLANSRGWKHLKKHIESLKDGLDKRLAEAVLKSMGNDQIRTDAVFAVLGKELLNSIINRVEDSASEVEKIKNEQSRKK